MFDYNNKQINNAEPSTPVEVIGFEGVTKAGDDFIVLNEEEKINEILEFRRSGYDKKLLNRQMTAKIFLETLKRLQHSIL